MVHSDPSAHSSESGIHGSKIDNLAGDVIGGYSRFHSAVAETVTVKFIIKALETYFPRMAQTLQNERETLESQNQRPDHSGFSDAFKSSRRGWLVQSRGKFVKT